MGPPSQKWISRSGTNLISPYAEKYCPGSVGHDRSSLPSSARRVVTSYTVARTDLSRLGTKPPGVRRQVVGGDVVGEPDHVVTSPESGSGLAGPSGLHGQDNRRPADVERAWCGLSDVAQLIS